MRSGGEDRSASQNRGNQPGGDRSSKRAWARSTHARLSTWHRVSANRTTPAIAGSFSGHSAHASQMAAFVQMQQSSRRGLRSSGVGPVAIPMRQPRVV